MPIRGLIFDFDGLILETEGPEYSSWRELYEDYGGSLPLEKWAEIIGTAEHGFDPYAELETQLGRQLDRAGIRIRREARVAELLAAEAVLPGVLGYIADASRLGLRLGVASSSSREWVVGHLQRLGIAHNFDAVACRDDVPRTKPDPALYLSVLSALELRPDEAIAVEDSPNGIAAAKAAGLYCVAVPNDLTSGLSLDRADLRLTSLEELSLEELLVRVGEHRKFKDVRAEVSGRSQDGR